MNYAWAHASVCEGFRLKFVKRLLNAVALSLLVHRSPLCTKDAMGAIDVARVLHSFPGTRIPSIVIDRDRFVWFGTENGPVRYDGFSWEAMFEETIERAPVSSMVLDTQGSLWVGRVGRHELVRWRAGKLTQYPIENVSALAVQGATLWIGTTHGLFRINQDRLSPAAMSEPIRSLFVASTDELFVGHAKGVSVMRRDEPLLVAEVVDVTTVGADSLGHIWIGSVAHGRLRILDDMLKDLPAPFLPPIHAFLPRRDGSMLVASDLGLLQVDGAMNVEGLNVGTGFDKRLLALNEDFEGGVWIGTAGSGALRINLDPIVRALGADAGHSEVAFSIAEDREGGVWVATSDSLLHGRVSHFDRFAHGPASSLPYDLRSVTAAKLGGIWAGSQQSGLWRITIQQELLQTANRASKGVNVVYEDPNGALWVGWEKGGLSRLAENDGAFETIAAPVHHMVSTISEAKGGGLWVGTRGGGIFRLFADKSSGRVYGTAEGLRDPSVIALAELQGEIPCVASEGGGFDCLVRERFVHFGSREGGTDKLIGSLVADNEGGVWAGTTAGVLRLEISTEPLRIQSSETFGLSAGLRSAESVRGPGRAGILAASGNVLIATTSGVAQINPLALLNRPNPKIVIDKVIVNGALVGALGDTVTAPVGDGTLAVRYTAPTFEGADQLSFRYKLQGQDRGWVQAGSRRSAHYTNLAPGTYRFEVSVNDGPARSQAMIAVRLTPPFYRTGIFIGCVLVASSYVLFLFVRLQRRQAMDKRNAVDQERLRLARDLHDTVEQSVSAVRYQLDSAIHDLRFNGRAVTSALDHIDRGITLLGGASSGMRTAIFALRSSTLPPVDLSMALSISAGRMLRGTVVKFEIETVGCSFVVSTQTSAQVIAIFEEAVTNALKHACATTIKLVVATDGGNYDISIADNGRGFDPDSPIPAGHFGILGMNERAKSIGGFVTVRGGVGVGTTVQLHFFVEPRV